jgi:K+-transporting ATPase KdpF subunit
MILDLCVLQEAAGASPANHNAEPENERKTSMESRRANGFSFALESFRAGRKPGGNNGRRAIRSDYGEFFYCHVAIRARLRPSLGGTMELEYLLGLIVSIFVLIYLLYALLWPEKF